MWDSKDKTTEMKPEHCLPGLRVGDRCDCMRVFLEGDGNVLSFDYDMSYMNLYICQNS